MSIIVRVTICIVLYLHMNVAQGQDAILLESQIENKEIANLITQNAALFPNNTQLSIALIDGDKTTYIGIIRNQDELKTIKNNEAIFEIGSITKVFTSVLLSKKIQENNLNLDDKIYSVLPVSDENASQDVKSITIQMLANHTSGLPRISLNMLPAMLANQENPFKEYTTELLNEFYAGEVFLDNSPSSTYGYSNLGAGTLGYILAEKSNVSYEDLLQRDILKPLEMTNSSTVLSQTDPSKLVVGQNAEGSETSNWDLTDATVGAGGIKSNVLDMERFIRKNFEDDATYNLPQKPTFTVNPNLQIGLGWHIMTEEGKTLLWHNGATGGYRSCMVLNKEHKKRF